MQHYRIYFLAQDGRIEGRPAEMQAATDEEVVMRALMAERNVHGAEIWSGAKLIKRVAQEGQPFQAAPGPTHGSKHA